MAKYEPPVIQRMLDRCEVCGRKTHRKDLVLQSQEQVDMQGENRFPYSSYNTSGWDCTSADSGQTSYGTGVAMYMNTPGLSSTTIEQPELLGGVQTWDGAGVMLSTVPVDASSADTICVSAQVGVKQGDSSTLTVVMGLCDSGGSTLEPMRTWAFTGTHKRVWFTANVADITTTSTAIYVYFSVACTGKWWIDEMQFELDATKPGTFVETTGAAKAVVADTRIYAGKKVCKRCRRPKWELNPGVTKPEQADRWETWGI